jgi:hypothetical protein
MIEFKDGSYYLGVWFVGGKDTDWMGCAWREEGSPNWIFRARFRYHNPESRNPFDAMDRKSFTSWQVDGRKKSEAEIERDVTKIAKLIGLRFGVEPEFVEIRGDRDKALFNLAMKPWAHVRMLGKEPKDDDERRPTT